MAEVSLHGASRIRGWLLDEVCPFWFGRITDPAGGFFEALNGASQALLSPERTVLNQARLTYVASHAYLLGKDEGMLKAAEHGFAFLHAVLDPAAPSMGWPRRISVDGKVLDETRDAYDHAFVIFAMAWYYRATGNAEAMRLAGLTLDFMQAHLADGLRGGFYEECPDTEKLPRRQNPHMHLLEAVLAMHEATGQSRWLEQAHQLVGLFESRFCDPATGALVEYFNADWSVAPGAAGQLREPGHQFEWVWLLGQYARASGRAEAPRALAQELFTFGSRFGIDREDALGGAVFDGLDGGGGVVADTKLFWPQTEYIKACLQQYEWTGDVHFMRAAQQHTELLRRHFFREDGANWCNQLSRWGEPAVDATPSRVLYHLFLAMAELIRVEEAA